MKLKTNAASRGRAAGTRQQDPPGDVHPSQPRPRRAATVRIAACDPGQARIDHDVGRVQVLPAQCDSGTCPTVVADELFRVTHQEPPEESDARIDARGPARG